MKHKQSIHDLMVPILQKGFISVPTTLITRYNRLGLSEKQIMFLLHIIVFQEIEGKMFPSIHDLALRMNLSREEIMECIQGLVENQYLVIENGMDERGIYVEKYSVTPLFEKLLLLS